MLQLLEMSTRETFSGTENYILKTQKINKYQEDVRIQRHIRVPSPEMVLFSKLKTIRDLDKPVTG